MSAGGKPVTVPPDLTLVEEEWYDLTKGELDLTECPDPAEVALVTAMWDAAATFAATFDAEQYGHRNREIDAVGPDEIARRVGASLYMLWYGWTA